MTGELLFIFVCGVVSGFMVAIVFMLEMGRRALSKKLDTKVKTNTLTDRMKRVKDITTEQIELNRQIDGPQKNGLDGKYKNGLINKLKKLDEEKNDILKSILLDGYDPELTTMDTSGVVTQMKLSEYMVLMGIKMEPKKPTTGVRAEKVGKFTVVKGGKDDDGNKTSH